MQNFGTIGFCKLQTYGILTCLGSTYLTQPHLLDFTRKGAVIFCLFALKFILCVLGF